MRILFFSHYFPPEGTACANRTFAHCKRWSAAGHDVTVVTCFPHHPGGTLYPGYRNRLRKIEYIERVRVVRVFTYLAANKGIWKRAVNHASYLLAAVLFGFFERKPDIVIATSGSFFCGCTGVLISKFRRLPLLLEIRDLLPESIVAVGAIRSKAITRILERLEQWMYRGARHIVTVGDGYRQGLIDRGVEPERISIVMNGVDRERFQPRPKDRKLADRLGVTDRFVVTYCGSIGMAHGLEVVLRAAALLWERGRREIVFLMVGDGAECRDLRAQAVRQGLHNVIFTGSLDRGLIANVLSISDVCFVHLKKAKTFEAVMPSKIFEAATMARPMILGIRGFAQEFVEKAACGLCMEPSNELELVDAILRLSDDANLRERLGRAGHAYVVGQFDRDRMAERYLQIIEQVLHASSEEAATAARGS